MPLSHFVPAYPSRPPSSSPFSTSASLFLKDSFFIYGINYPTVMIISLKFILGFILMGVGGFFMLREIPQRGPKLPLMSQKPLQ